MLDTIRQYRQMVGDREFIFELVAFPIAMIMVGIILTGCAAVF